MPLERNNGDTKVHLSPRVTLVTYTSVGEMLVKMVKGAIWSHRGRITCPWDIWEEGQNFFPPCTLGKGKWGHKRVLEGHADMCPLKI